MTLQDTITTQASTTVKQIQEFVDGLPKPVEVVETVFGYYEVALANAKTVAIKAATAITPEAPKAKKPAAKKTVAAASPAAE